MVLGHRKRHPSGPSGPVQQPTGPSGPVSEIVIGAPQGLISGAPANNGKPWANINRYDPIYRKWGGRFGLNNARRCKAMTVVESGGVDIDGGEPGSTGILQIKPAYWSDTATRLGVSLQTPDGQIAVCMAILDGESGHGDYGNWEANFRRLYFPGDDPYTGITQDAYVAWIKQGSALIEAAAGTTPAPSGPSGPAPVPVDPISVIVGGRSYPPVTYGFGHDEGIDSYAYGPGHGKGLTRSTQHPGDDVGVPHLTPLYSPLAGTVLCVGNRGQNVWGNGCGYYVDDMDGGDGNLTILFDGGLRMTLGHCHRILVSPGDRVQAGQKVALSGGSSGDHFHLECAIYAPEKVNRSLTPYPDAGYWLLDPVPALKAAMGGITPDPAAGAVPYNWDAPDRNLFVVTVLNDSIGVYQRADAEATRLGTLQRGESFEAVAQVPGNDKLSWWLRTDDARIPVLGTTSTIKVG